MVKIVMWNLIHPMRLFHNISHTFHDRSNLLVQVKSGNYIYSGSSQFYINCALVWVAVCYKTSAVVSISWTNVPYLLLYFWAKPCFDNLSAMSKSHVILISYYRSVKWKKIDIHLVGFEWNFRLSIFGLISIILLTKTWSNIYQENILAVPSLGPDGDPTWRSHPTHLRQFMTQTENSIIICPFSSNIADRYRDEYTTFAVGRSDIAEDNYNRNHFDNVEHTMFHLNDWWDWWWWCWCWCWCWCSCCWRWRRRRRSLLSKPDLIELNMARSVSSECCGSQVSMCGHTEAFTSCIRHHDLYKAV